jgi:hypothetical protein
LGIVKRNVKFNSHLFVVLPEDGDSSMEKSGYDKKRCSMKRSEWR